MTPLEYIIEKAVESNPSIAELVATGATVRANAENIYRQREISLADILLAIGFVQKRSSYYVEVGSGRFIKSESTGHNTSADTDTGIYYNLKQDDIRLQSPETQLFIAKLLGYKD